MIRFMVVVTGGGWSILGFRLESGYFLRLAPCPPYAIGYVQLDPYLRLGIGWFFASHGWVREPQLGFPFKKDIV